MKDFSQFLRTVKKYALQCGCIKYKVNTSYTKHESESVHILNSNVGAPTRSGEIHMFKKNPV